MKNKIVKKFEYDGLGFPITLVNVPMREYRGEVIPDIDYNKLQNRVILVLSTSPLPLTGNEVRFIRQYFQMTLVQFAKCFGVTHPTVINWEKTHNESARISPTTEVYIRLFILEKLEANNSQFRAVFREFDCDQLSQNSKIKNKRRRNSFLVDLN